MTYMMFSNWITETSIRIDKLEPQQYVDVEDVCVSDFDEVSSELLQAFKHASTAEGQVEKNYRRMEIKVLQYMTKVTETLFEALYGK